MLASSEVYKITVKTGDRKRAGTDANVTIVLRDCKGNSTKEAKLDNFLRDDFERGRTDKFTVKDKTKLDEVHFIELCRDDAGLFSDWYVDHVTVTIKSSDQDFVFPIYRWIRPNFKYRIVHLDTFLPQEDPHQEQRQIELEEKKNVYEYEQKITDGPSQQCMRDEQGERKAGGGREGEG
ncbi:hypothetical protein FSP39_009132 [Pinctada imbricata]|uniref:PLAT domain-containing protein n=1 Tax=Pinctada imbricata TaxID=66713 RepID=A0AA89BX57_PINIB|nr:hypothetical protein FSP39_009132 [Pinctada imbricata]